MQALSVVNFRNKVSHECQFQQTNVHYSLISKVGNLVLSAPISVMFLLSASTSYTCECYCEIDCQFDDLNLKKPRNAKISHESLNYPLCAYLMRKNLHNGTHLKSIHILRALMVIFNVWKTCKNFAKDFFVLMIKLGTWVNDMFSPTFEPYLVTSAWNMSAAMPKELGSLNGLLCTYLMRQNLHNQTCSEILRQWMSLPSLKMICEKLWMWEH